MDVLFSSFRCQARHAGTTVRDAFRIQRAARTFTLRQLASTLQSVCDSKRPPPVYLSRLMALVSADLALAIRHPGQRGGPDTVRTLGAWRSRYNHLDRYLPRG